MKSLLIIPITTILSLLFIVNERSREDINYLNNVQGYINHNNSCLASDECSTSGSEICTVGNISGGTQLFGKSSTGLCTLILYKPN